MWLAHAPTWHRDRKNSFPSKPTTQRGTCIMLSCADMVEVLLAAMSPLAIEGGYRYFYVVCEGQSPRLSRGVYLRALVQNMPFCNCFHIYIYIIQFRYCLAQLTDHAGCMFKHATTVDRSTQYW